MKNITIIDYEVGNIKSLGQAIRFLGFDFKITRDKNLIEKSTHIILPGVGAFGHCAANIKKYKLFDPLKNFINSEKNFLGICVGMQLLFTKSYEFGEFNGLNVIDGVIKKIKSNKFNDIKLPNIGWNKINKPIDGSWDKTVFANFNNYVYQYFVHSYYPVVSNKEFIIGTINYYDLNLPVAFKKKNVYGFQFHPEKSGKNGIEILKNFLMKD